MSRRRRRNYAAMKDEKLFRCYWELRNGLKRAGKPRTVGDDLTEWDSAFGYTAYDICMRGGSGIPRGDCIFIEEYCETRGIPLIQGDNWQPHNALRRRALGGTSINSGEMPKPKIIPKEETTDVIVI